MNAFDTDELILTNDRRQMNKTSRLKQKQLNLRFKTLKNKQEQVGGAVTLQTTWDIVNRPTRGTVEGKQNITKNAKLLLDFIEKVNFNNKDIKTKLETIIDNYDTIKNKKDRLGPLPSELASKETEFQKFQEGRPSSNVVKPVTAPPPALVNKPVEPVDEPAVVTAPPAEEYDDLPSVNKKATLRNDTLRLDENADLGEEDVVEEDKASDSTEFTLNPTLTPNPNPPPAPPAAVTKPIMIYITPKFKDDDGALIKIPLQILDIDQVKDVAAFKLLLVNLKGNELVLRPEDFEKDIYNQETDKVTIQGKVFLDPANNDDSEVIKDKLIKLGLGAVLRDGWNFIITSDMINISFGGLASSPPDDKKPYLLSSTLQSVITNSDVKQLLDDGSTVAKDIQIKNYLVDGKNNVLAATDYERTLKGLNFTTDTTLYVRSALYIFFYRLLYGDLYYMIDVQYIRNIYSYLDSDPQYLDLIQLKPFPHKEDPNADNSIWDDESITGGTKISAAADTNLIETTTMKRKNKNKSGGGDGQFKSSGLFKSPAERESDTKYVGFPVPEFTPQNVQTSTDNFIKALIGCAAEDSNKLFDEILGASSVGILSKVNAEIAKKIGVLIGNLEPIQTELEKRNAKILELGGMIEAFESSNANLNAKTKRLQQNVQQALTQNQELLTDILTHEATITTLQEAIQKGNVNRDELQSQIYALSEQVEDLQAKLAEKNFVKIIPVDLSGLPEEETQNVAELNGYLVPVNSWSEKYYNVFINEIRSLAEIENEYAEIKDTGYFDPNSGEEGTYVDLDALDSENDNKDYLQIGEEGYEDLGNVASVNKSNTYDNLVINNEGSSPEGSSPEVKENPAAPVYTYGDTKLVAHADEPVYARAIGGGSNQSGGGLENAVDAFIKLISNSSTPIEKIEADYNSLFVRYALKDRSNTVSVLTEKLKEEFVKDKNIIRIKAIGEKNPNADTKAPQFYQIIKVAKEPNAKESIGNVLDFKLVRMSDENKSFYTSATEVQKLKGEVKDSLSLEKNIKLKGLSPAEKIKKIEKWLLQAQEKKDSKNIEKYKKVLEYYRTKYGNEKGELTELNEAGDEIVNMNTYSDVNQHLSAIKEAKQYWCDYILGTGASTAAPSTAAPESPVANIKQFPESLQPNDTEKDKMVKLFKMKYYLNFIAFIFLDAQTMNESVTLFENKNILKKINAYYQNVNIGDFSESFDTWKADGYIKRFLTQLRINFKIKEISRSSVNKFGEFKEILDKMTDAYAKNHMEMYVSSGNSKNETLYKIGKIINHGEYVKQQMKRIEKFLSMIRCKKFSPDGTITLISDEELAKGAISGTDKSSAIESAEGALLQNKLVYNNQSILYKAFKTDYVGQPINNLYTKLQGTSGSNPAENILKHFFNYQDQDVTTGGKAKGIDLIKNMVGTATQSLVPLAQAYKLALLRDKAALESGKKLKEAAALNAKKQAALSAAEEILDKAKEIAQAMGATIDANGVIGFDLLANADAAPTIKTISTGDKPLESNATDNSEGTLKQDIEGKQRDQANKDAEERIKKEEEEKRKKEEEEEKRKKLKNEEALKNFKVKKALNATEKEKEKLKEKTALDDLESEVKKAETAANQAETEAAAANPPDKNLVAKATSSRELATQRKEKYIKAKQAYDNLAGGGPLETQNDVGDRAFRIKNLLDNDIKPILEANDFDLRRKVEAVYAANEKIMKPPTGRVTKNDVIDLVNKAQVLRDAIVKKLGNKPTSSSASSSAATQGDRGGLQDLTGIEARLKALEAAANKSKIDDDEASIKAIMNGEDELSHKIKFLVNIPKWQLTKSMGSTNTDVEGAVKGIELDILSKDIKDTKENVKRLIDEVTNQKLKATQLFAKLKADFKKEGKTLKEIKEYFNDEKNKGDVRAGDFNKRFGELQILVNEEESNEGKIQQNKDLLKSEISAANPAPQAQANVQANQAQATNVQANTTPQASASTTIQTPAIATTTNVPPAIVPPAIVQKTQDPNEKSIAPPDTTALKAKVADPEKKVAELGKDKTNELKTAQDALNKADTKLKDAESNGEKVGGGRWLQKGGFPVSSTADTNKNTDVSSTANIDKNTNVNPLASTDANTPADTGADPTATNLTADPTADTNKNTDVSSTANTDENTDANPPVSSTVATDAVLTASSTANPPAASIVGSTEIPTVSSTEGSDANTGTDTTVVPPAANLNADNDENPTATNLTANTAADPNTDIKAISAEIAEANKVNNTAFDNSSKGSAPNKSGDNNAADTPEAKTPPAKEGADKPAEPADNKAEPAAKKEGADASADNKAGETPAAETPAETPAAKEGETPPAKEGANNPPVKPEKPDTKGGSKSKHKQSKHKQSKHKQSKKKGKSRSKKNKKYSKKRKQ